MQSCNSMTTALYDVLKLPSPGRRHRGTRRSDKTVTSDLTHTHTHIITGTGTNHWHRHRSLRPKLRAGCATGGARQRSGGVGHGGGAATAARPSTWRGDWCVVGLFILLARMVGGVGVETRGYGEGPSPS